MPETSSTLPVVRPLGLFGPLGHFGPFRPFGPFALACLAAACAAAHPSTAAAAGRLNDTGLLACISASSEIVSCAGTGQDGEFGRDVERPNDSDGRAGFRFTRLCNSGQVPGQGSCPAEPVPGNGPDDWGCTRDETTRLVWEVKTTDGSLRDMGRNFSFFTPGYDPDGLYGSRQDVSGYVAAVNQAGLCGARDWRLPTPPELVGLADMGLTSIPSIDLDWFPNTVAGSYWAAGTVQGQPFAPQLAWQADFAFGFGSVSAQFRSSPRAVRLVRGIGPAGLRPSADGQVVTDLASGLQWRRCVEGQQFDGVRCSGTVLRLGWQAALERARSQAAQTGEGWRLPNAKELASLQGLQQAGAGEGPLLRQPASAAVQWTSSALLIYRLPRCLSFTDGSSTICNAGTPLALRLVKDAGR